MSRVDEMFAMINREETSEERHARIEKEFWQTVNNEKCTKCRSPAWKICLRDYCPQGIALFKARHDRAMACLSTCTSVEALELGHRLLESAAQKASKLKSGV